jgi:CBS domain-containing protein
MADKSHETKTQNGGSNSTETPVRPAAQAVRSGAEGMQQAGERAADRTGELARGTAQGMRRAGEAGGEMMRQAADAGAETMRHLGGTAGEAMRRAPHAAAAGERSAARSAARHVEETGARVAQAMQESARDMRTLFALRAMSRDGLEQMREGVGILVEGVLRTNMRMVEELFRMASPSNTVELQRRMGAEYLDTMLHSSVKLLRAARHAAEDALRPLEEHVEERQQRRHAAHDGHGQGQGHGRVGDVMATDLRIASPDDTVQRAAQMMREADAGALPVGEGDRLVGMVTDRDVALRLVAEGRDPSQTRVRDVMTPEVRYVFEDEDLDHVADNMAEQQVRRLPVMNRDRRLVGVITLADLARRGHGDLAARAHGAPAHEDGQHAQAAE